MKQVLIDRYGAPEEVARCAEVPDVGAPAAGEVVFDVLAFPINPADVGFCRRTYRFSMSGEDPVMPRGALTGGGQTLVGFILGRGLSTRSLEQIRALYAELGEQIVKGVLSAPVEKVYAIDEIKTALAHAQRGERAGKILVTP